MSKKMHSINRDTSEREVSWLSQASKLLVTLENCVRPRFNCTSFKSSAVLYPINSTYNFVLSVPFEYAMLIDFNGSYRHREGKNWANYLFKAEHHLKYLLKCLQSISESAPASFSRSPHSSNGRLRGPSPCLTLSVRPTPQFDWDCWGARTLPFSLYVPAGLFQISPWPNHNCQP